MSDVSLEADIKQLREMNEKLQEEYVDLICQFADFSAQATENTIRMERIRQILTQHVTETNPEQLQRAVQMALAYLSEE